MSVKLFFGSLGFNGRGRKGGGGGGNLANYEKM